MLVHNINLWEKLVFGMFICPLSTLQGQASADNLSAATDAVLFFFPHKPAFSKGNNLFMWYHQWTSLGYPWESWLRKKARETDCDNNVGGCCRDSPVFWLFFFSCRTVSYLFLASSNELALISSSSYRMGNFINKLLFGIIINTIIIIIVRRRRLLLSSGSS